MKKLFSHLFVAFIFLLGVAVEFAALRAVWLNSFVSHRTESGHMTWLYIQIAITTVLAAFSLTVVVCAWRTMQEQTT